MTYPAHCFAAQDGFHLMTVDGTPRSAMTYRRCRICGGRWQRGAGAFYGTLDPTPPTLEQRVTALEAAMKRTEYA